MNATLSIEQFGQALSSDQAQSGLFEALRKLTNVQDTDLVRKFNPFPPKGGAEPMSGWGGWAW